MDCYIVVVVVVVAIIVIIVVVVAIIVIIVVVVVAIIVIIDIQNCWYRPQVVKTLYCKPPEAYTFYAKIKVWWGPIPLLI